MKISEAKFVRKYNVGQYESEEYSLAAVVEDGDQAVDVLSKLKADVHAAYCGEKSEADPAEAASAPAPKKPKKGKTKPVPEVDEEDEDEATEEADEETADESEEETEDEESEETDSDEETDEDEETEEEAPAKKPSKTGSAKTKTATKTTPSSSKGTGKNFKSKAQKYQRTNEQHKEIYSALMKQVAPDWKKTEASKAKAKKVSIQMEGKEFLNADGEVLPAFKAEVKKGMGKK